MIPDKSFVCKCLVKLEDSYEELESQSKTWLQIHSQKSFNFPINEMSEDKAP